MHLPWEQTYDCCSPAHASPVVLRFIFACLHKHAHIISIQTGRCTKGYGGEEADVSCPGHDPTNLHENKLLTLSRFWIDSWAGKHAWCIQTCIQGDDSVYA